jgi:hypothetical protein
MGTMSSILFGGLQHLLDYRRSVDERLPINANTLHFFTKEFLKRQLVELSANIYTKKTALPRFDIYVDQKDVASLNSNLPASGKIRYVSGHLKVSQPELASDIQLRYRGGLPLHWLYDKKSFRIKLPPYTTYLGERQFNLVNPSTIHTITDWISYEMARSLGLLTPDYFPARVNINNSTNGMHYFLSQIDESFLRKNKRMPGSIYSGDTIYSPNPFGVDKRGVGEDTYKDEDGISLMWVDERLWEKDAARNAESAHDRTDIQKFIEIINEEDPIRFMEAFEDYFDKQKFYLFWGLDTMLGSYHHDNFHNHKIYFDPYLGKFEPIEWDIRFWSSIFLSKDLPVNPLLKQVKLNPLLEFERDLVTYELLDRFPVKEVHELIDRASKNIEAELRQDPFRQAPDERYGRFKLNKEVPFSIEEYHTAIEALKLTYQSRHEYLKTVFSANSTVYTITQNANNSVLLRISVGGNSPIRFYPWQMLTTLADNVQISRLYQGRRMPVNLGDTEMLYPGRSIHKGNVLERSDSWAILAFGKEKLIPAPLQYEYLFEGIKLENINLHGSNARNAITGQPATLKPTTELPSMEQTASVHPWLIQFQSTSQPREVVLSGTIDINNDQIYSSSQTVKILPGTTFRIAKGQSLIFYGKVLAEGTKNSPIKIKQLVPGDPWGSIVIHGAAASGSVFRHIEVKGGSVTTQRLVRYPGQINIHGLPDFRLEFCTISDNQIGDDALHVAYSQGEIRNCRFRNTAFDALDMDIAHVTVADSQFHQIGNDALDLMTSKIIIQDTLIEGAGDKCISVGEESEVEVKKTRLHYCHIGIAVKDESRAYVEDLDFLANKQTAIALYQKNPRYSAGGTIDGKRLYGIEPSDISSDPGSISRISPGAFLPASEYRDNNAPSLTIGVMDR